MPSFYEMNALLQKNRKGQHEYNEAFGDLLSQLMAKLQPKSQTPAPAAPPAQTASVPPITHEPDEPTPEPGNQPAAAPSQLKKTNLARRKIAGAPAQPVVNTAPDINDPASPEMQALKAGVEEEIPRGMRMGKGRGLTKKLQTISTLNPKSVRSANFADRLGKMNDFLRYKSFAAKMQWALELTGTDMSKFEMGTPFSVSIDQPGQSGVSAADDRPEVVLSMAQYRRAMRKLREWRGSTGYSNDETGGYGDRTVSLLGALWPEYTRAQTHPEYKPVVMRAVEFANKLLDRDVAPHISGKFESLGNLAKKLGKLLPLPKQDQLQGGLPGVEDPHVALRQAAGKQPLPGATPEDPDLDLKALALVVNKARKFKHRFIQTQGDGPVTPETPVMIVPPSELGILPKHSKDPVLGGKPTAAGGADPRAADIGDARSRALAFKRAQIAKAKARRQQAEQLPPDEPTPEPPMEATQWMELQELIEHWGF